MSKIGFDNDKYVELQSANILDRIAQFGNKLYLEFGGKLFDDYHLCLMNQISCKLKFKINIIYRSLIRLFSILPR